MTLEVVADPASVADACSGMAETDRGLTIVLLLLAIGTDFVRDDGTARQESDEQKSGTLMLVHHQVEAPDPGVRAKV